MDVRIGGVVVGSIASIDLTDDKKAAVVLQIDNADYHDFRKDALLHDPPAVADRRALHRVRADAAQARQRAEAAAARQGAVGPRRGPVPAAGDEHGALGRPGPDQNIMRLPYRQKFTIFLNEFGTGLRRQRRGAADAR